ncbi:hypothetical protein DUI87_08863 [Hirundo rustica rustica]|uniref:Uncharacterized protein n=1 Tax=Hirundo rustica rustica TaxID=333673 RepID=A0A3M0KMC8_HIRRU|nr:hypothetical protein DUI87_08863 [Hirundo rustica rustica]
MEKTDAPRLLRSRESVNWLNRVRANRTWGAAVPLATGANIPCPVQLQRGVREWLGWVSGIQPGATQHTVKCSDPAHQALSVFAPHMPSGFQKWQTRKQMEKEQQHMADIDLTMEVQHKVNGMSSE